MSETTNLSNLIYGITTKKELDDLVNLRYFGERVFIDPPTQTGEVQNLVRLANDLLAKSEARRAFSILDGEDYSINGPFCHVMSYLAGRIEFLKNGADPGDYNKSDLENFCDGAEENFHVRFGNFTIGKRIS